MNFIPRKNSGTYTPAKPIQFSVADIMGEVHDKYITVYMIMEHASAVGCKSQGIDPKSFSKKTVALGMNEKEALKIYKDSLLKEAIDSELSIVKITIPKILVRIERDSDDNIISVESHYKIQPKYIEEVTVLKSKAGKGTKNNGRSKAQVD